MPEQPKTVLGFDFGTHWIGVAVGQTASATASPLKPVAVINGKPDWQAISGLIDEWRPQRLVVGFPLKMDDSDTDMTQPCKRFSRQLEGRYAIPTDLIDERLTTREAWQLSEDHAHKKLSKPQLDSVAAVLITETWLHDRH